MVGSARRESPWRAKGKTLGAASIVFGIISMCISWLPYGCWLGVFLGVMACLLGVPSITRWYQKAGYGPWGVSGIVLGLSGFILSVAYTVKYASGALDGIVLSLEGALPAAIMVSSSSLVAVGLVLARKRRKQLILGELMAFIGVAVFGLSGAWTLITADQTYEQQRTELQRDQ
jgi:drug/metabolite transporter (DMT)-like permease